jgi:hypothetical protein
MDVQRDFALLSAVPLNMLRSRKCDPLRDSEAFFVGHFDTSAVGTFCTGELILRCPACQALLGEKKHPYIIYFHSQEATNALLYIETTCPITRTLTSSTQAVRIRLVFLVLVPFNGAGVSQMLNKLAWSYDSPHLLGLPFDCFVSLLLFFFTFSASVLLLLVVEGEPAGLGISRGG